MSNQNFKPVWISPARILLCEAVSMDAELELVLQQITDNLDQRRFEINKLRRVVLRYVAGPLESSVARMTIPMIYAQWEGYVKEVCQIYLEYIESVVSRCKDLKPAIIGYLWTPMLRPLVGGINLERKKRVAEYVLNSLENPVAFSTTEKAIETRSNLNYAVLEEIAESLSLDITQLYTWKTHLNALVNLRNNIAHGSRPRNLDYEDFSNHALAIIRLMENFERIVISSLESKSFCKT